MEAAVLIHAMAYGTMKHDRAEYHQKTTVEISFNVNWGRGGGGGILFSV